MPESVKPMRRPLREDGSSFRSLPDGPTFAEVATRYLERHVRRHLVPRAYQLALYAHAFLATVEVPAPTGGTISFPEKPFHLITTDDVEEAIEQKARPGVTTVRRPGRRTWTRRVGGGPTANRLHAHLRGLWRWAIAKGYTDRTPFARAGLRFETPRRLAGRDANEHLIDHAPVQRVGIRECLGRRQRDLLAIAPNTGPTDRDFAPAQHNFARRMAGARRVPVRRMRIAGSTDGGPIFFQHRLEHLQA